MLQSALYIGRFQPFHLGHLSIVKRGVAENERLIIAIGSAEKNFLPENPLTASERIVMIEEVLRDEKIPAEKYCIIPVNNINNYALWVNHVNLMVPPYDKLYTGSKIVEICYRHNPNTFQKIINIEREENISATQIRDLMRTDRPWEHLVHPTVSKLLKAWDIPRRLKNTYGMHDITMYNNNY